MATLEISAYRPRFAGADRASCLLQADLFERPFPIQRGMPALTSPLLGRPTSLGQRAARGDRRRIKGHFRGASVHLSSDFK